MGSNLKVLDSTVEGYLGCKAETTPNTDSETGASRSPTRTDLLDACYMGVFINGGTPKLDGLFHGKSHLEMDDN